MSFLRYFVAILVGLTLFLAFHKSIAADATAIDELKTIETWVTEETQPSLECPVLVPEIQNYSRHLQEEYEALSEYVREISEVYSEWYEQLKPLEGKNLRIEPGHFNSLGRSAENLAETATFLFDHVYAIEGILDEIIQAANDCLSGRDLTDAMNLIEEFRMKNAEHLGTTAEYLSRMSERLGEMTLSLKNLLEGRVGEVPAELFKPLLEHCDEFAEAAEYIRDNGKFAYQEFVGFLARLRELAPALRAR